MLLCLFASVLTCWNIIINWIWKSTSSFCVNFLKPSQTVSSLLPWTLQTLYTFDITPHPTNNSFIGGESFHRRKEDVSRSHPLQLYVHVCSLHVQAERCQNLCSLQWRIQGEHSRCPLPLTGNPQSAPGLQHLNPHETRTLQITANFYVPKEIDK